MRIYIFLYTAPNGVVQAYGPFWSKVVARAAAVKRFGNDAEVAFVTLNQSLEGTIYIPARREV
jgi:hypothetical protein